MTTTGFDCRLDLSLWESKWSLSKKDWCCKQVGIGCTTTHMVPTTPEARGDAPPVPVCAVPSSSLDLRDREWCCRVHGVHCKSILDIIAASHAAPQMQPRKMAVTTTRRPPMPEGPSESVAYDCMAEYVDGGRQWSARKRTWCCQHERRGCHVSPTQYDCTYWFSVEIWTWPIEKKEWCCEHRGRGCRKGKRTKDLLGLEVTTKHPTTSMAGVTTSHALHEMSCFDGHLHLWSDRKRAWCCHHEGRGCSEPKPTPASASFDCEEGYWDWQMAWPDSKREWCCEHHQRGCVKRADKSQLFTGISRKFEASAGSRASVAGTTTFTCAAALLASLFAIRACSRRRQRQLSGYTFQTALWTSMSVSRGPLNVELDELSE
jgi:hypothetical protein